MSSIVNLVYVLPHDFLKNFRLKILIPHGIFAAGGAFVPTQEKKKDLRS